MWNFIKNVLVIVFTSISFITFLILTILSPVICTFIAIIILKIFAGNSSEDMTYLAVFLSFPIMVVFLSLILIKWISNFSGNPSIDLNNPELKEKLSHLDQLYMKGIISTQEYEIKTDQITKRYKK